MPDAAVPYLFPDNYMWTLAAMLPVNCEGAIGEIYPLCQSLQEASRQGNVEAWYEGWVGLAAKTEALARKEEEQGNRLSAGDTYKRAAVYLQAAERLLEIGSDRRVAVFCKSQELFFKYCEHAQPRIERVQMEYQESAISGYFLPAIGATGPAPCVAFFDGLDATAEMMAIRALGLPRRGIACLVVDGPGWGASLRLKGMTTRHDYEVVASSVVDYLETRPDVDAGRLGVMAISLGGYYAPRIAAFEQRFKAGAAWGAMWDYPRILQDRVNSRWAVNMPVSAPRDQAAWVFGVDSLEAAVEAAAGFRLDGVAQKITMPFLIVHGEADKQVPLSDAQALYEAIASPDKTLRVFTKAEGGVEHCQWDCVEMAQTELFDWFRERL